MTDVRSRIVVEVDERGRPLSMDGDPLPEVPDPRYDYSGQHRWACPVCGFAFTQALDVLIAVKVTHHCSTAAEG